VTLADQAIDALHAEATKLAIKGEPHQLSLIS
jgi:hypothetical protein